MLTRISTHTIITVLKPLITMTDKEAKEKSMCFRLETENAAIIIINTLSREHPSCNNHSLNY